MAAISFLHSSLLFQSPHNHPFLLPSSSEIFPSQHSYCYNRLHGHNQAVRAMVCCQIGQSIENRGLGLSRYGVLHRKTVRKNSTKQMRKLQGKCDQTLSAVASEIVQREAPEDLMKELITFLEGDLPHLFDEQGIDKSRYDKHVDFRDPITKYEGIDGYLFNIQLLRRLFSPKFELHQVQQTGPSEITTRWTMTMNFSLLPWRPELIFTGTSVMKVNPETGKFRSHFDYWDSIENNDYFSFEGFMDVLRQLRVYKVPDLETPDYKVLKRTADYEVREYRPFIVVETEVKGIAGSKGFNEIAGYIFGKNERGEKIQMTTPIFNQKLDGSSSERIQIVIPKKYRLSDLPSPLSKGVNLQEKGGGFAGVLKFSGKLSEDIVVQTESILRAALQRDRLNPQEGFMLARYNDPGRTPEFLQRHEVLIWLENYSLS